jgi:hypothetical protein
MTLAFGFAAKRLVGLGRSSSVRVPRLRPVVPPWAGLASVSEHPAKMSRHLLLRSSLCLLAGAPWPLTSRCRSSDRYFPRSLPLPRRADLRTYRYQWCISPFARAAIFRATLVSRFDVSRRCSVRILEKISNASLERVWDLGTNCRANPWLPAQLGSFRALERMRRARDH